MAASIDTLLSSYDVGAALETAQTIPSAWYTDARIAEMERQAVGRVDQVRDPEQFFTADVAGEPVTELKIGGLKFVQRRTYDLACNWKVFVDNYLDGGYHVPHIHKGLGSVLDYSEYKIEIRDRFCLQSSPISSGGGEQETAAVRG